MTDKLNFSLFAKALFFFGEQFLVMVMHFSLLSLKKKNELL